MAELDSGILKEDLKGKLLTGGLVLENAALDDLCLQLAVWITPYLNALGVLESAFFIEDFAAAILTWNINHLLNSVDLEMQAYDLDWIAIEGLIVIDDANNTHIDWIVAQAGHFVAIRQALSFTAAFRSATSSWNINHNLGTKAIRPYMRDLENNEISGSFTLVDDNNARVDWLTPQAGNITLRYA